MQAHIVIDLGFGDSGKGLCVDWLASQYNNSLVVRFSGGHQIGHTVHFQGRQHTFSNFGSGSFRGAPTYYTQDCTIFPPAIVVEAERLSPLKPQLIFHPQVRVCSPYDIAFNRAQEALNQHGSCGVGYGSTVLRHRAGVFLFAQDLNNVWVCRQRLSAIRSYYEKLCENDAILKQNYQRELEQVDDETYLEFCQQANDFYQIDSFDSASESFEHLIFEGSQGIMLDERFGVFPHVTPSNTSSQNVWPLLANRAQKIELYYLSRCYQTRHGNGPMSSNTPVKLNNNEHEANSFNPYQGEFRCAELDWDLLDYALRCERSQHAGSEKNENLLLTCVDQLETFDASFAGQWAQERELKLWCSRGPTAAHINLITA